MQPGLLCKLRHQGVELCAERIDLARAIHPSTILSAFQ
jgi:hypothetical protein